MAEFWAQATSPRHDGSIERSSLDADALETVLGNVFGLAVEPDRRPLLRRVVIEGRQ